MGGGSSGNLPSPMTRGAIWFGIAPQVQAFGITIPSDTAATIGMPKRVSITCGAGIMIL